MHEAGRSGSRRGFIIGHSGDIPSKAVQRSPRRVAWRSRCGLTSRRDRRGERTTEVRAMDRRFLLRFRRRTAVCRRVLRRIAEGRHAPFLARSPRRPRMAVRGRLEGAWPRACGRADRSPSRRSRPASARRRTPALRSSRSSRTRTTSATTAGLTQTLGWVDAWTPQPSVYAVRARNRRPTSRPPSTSRASTICASSSRAAATAIWARPTRRTRLLIWTRADERRRRARRLRAARAATARAACRP